MKRLLSLAILTAVLGTAASTAGAVVVSGPPSGGPPPGGPPHGPPGFGPPHDMIAAPEIDPASAMAGLTLLAGGLVVLRGRRSRKSED